MEKALVKTLWQYLKDKRDRKEMPITPGIHNELQMQPGQIVNFDIIDYRGHDLTIRLVEEWKLFISGQTFVSTDYFLTGSDDLKLRAINHNDQAKDDDCWLYTRYDEFGWKPDFQEVVETACQSTDGEPNTFDTEDASYVRFDSMNDLRYQARTTSSDGQKSRTVTYWDFHRMAKDEVGTEFMELLMIENNEDTGWTQIWIGKRVPLDRIFVV